MTNNEIVAKLWNLCNVLRDDGITYQDYVTELTYILFLKMAKETGAEKNIPEEYRWDNLSSKDGIELKKFYATLLQELGENAQFRVDGRECAEFALFGEGLERQRYGWRR